MDKARWTCFVCPVTQECDDYRFRSESKSGIWAGTYYPGKEEIEEWQEHTEPVVGFAEDGEPKLSTGTTTELKLPKVLPRPPRLSDLRSSSGGVRDTPDSERIVGTGS